MRQLFSGMPIPSLLAGSAGGAGVNGACVRGVIAAFSTQVLACARLVDAISAACLPFCCFSLLRHGWACIRYAGILLLYVYNRAL